MRKLLFLVLASTLLSSTAYGQVAGIYIRTPYCFNGPFLSPPWPLSFPIGQPFWIEIRAFADPGAQTFEFSIPGFTPADGIHVIQIVANREASSVEGNPFVEGARISFSTCQSTPVTLYTCMLLVFSPTQVPWIVAPHSSPSQPGTTCPTAKPCDGGSAFCVYAGAPQRLEEPPNSPSPQDGATDVPLDTSLDFNYQPSNCTCTQVYCRSLYLGVDPDPPLFASPCDGPFPDLHLDPSTTYYWRVAGSFCDLFNTPVWSFTTGPALNTASTTWSNVKKLFR